ALNIARGKSTKTTIARMYGNWVNKSVDEIYEDASKFIDDPDWIQVGMNPFRHSYFYDKRTGDAILSATEVLQVGPLVLARREGAELLRPGSKEFNEAFATKTASKKSVPFVSGGKVYSALRRRKAEGGRANEADLDRLLAIRGIPPAARAGILGNVAV
ncbi:uncharacterized protein METZ01_LOCUS282346, partial [marine metagenome]